MRGRVEAPTKGAEEQQPEIAAYHRKVGNQARKDAENGTALKGKATTEFARQHADRQRAEPHSEDHRGYRQGRQALVRCQHGTDDARGAYDDRVVAARQRLCGRQHQGVAPCQIVVWHDVRERLGNG